MNILIDQLGRNGCLKSGGYGMTHEISNPEAIMLTYMVTVLGLITGFSILFLI